MKKQPPSNAEPTYSHNLLMTRVRAEDELGRHIESGRSIVAKAPNTHRSNQVDSIGRDRKRWVSVGESLLRAIFETPKFAEEFAKMNQIHGVGLAFGGGGSHEEYCQAFIADTEEYIAKLEAAKEQLRLFAEPNSTLKPSENEALRVVRNLCERFPRAARQLENRRTGREAIKINDEYDVQYVLNSFLHTCFSDVRAEETTPSYAGGSSRMDFLLKDERLVLEVKMTRNNLRDKELGDELTIDAARYQTHPDCDTLVCFVYDPNHYLRNPSGLVRDLNRSEGKPKVEVIIQH